MKFRNVEYDVQAVQFNGENFDELEEICHAVPLSYEQATVLYRTSGRILRTDGKYCLVFVDEFARTHAVAVDDWVVKSEAGLYIVSDERFNRTYRLIEE